MAFSNVSDPLYPVYRQMRQTDSDHTIYEAEGSHTKYICKHYDGTWIGCWWEYVTITGFKDAFEAHSKHRAEEFVLAISRLGGIV